MIRLAIAAALATVVAGCAAQSSNRDVAAVVLDERARQAVSSASAQGEDAKAALSVAAEASEAPAEPPYRP